MYTAVIRQLWHQTEIRSEKGLEREDLFTVVHDLFLTETAKYADIILPATSSYENTDFYASLLASLYANSAAHY